jgi:hypothetical protein
MMKKSLLLPLALLVLVAAPLFAQEPFDGTWRTNLDQSKFSPKPLTMSLVNGQYDCLTCNPQIHVLANGQDQPVTGQSYETISVREVDPTSIAVATKKGGKLVFEQTRTVSADGNTMTVKTTSYPQNSDQPITSEVTATRTAAGPAGSNATSGSWRIEKVQESDNGLVSTYRTEGGMLSMSTPAGESYTAGFDGRDYPVKGAYSVNTVSLRRINKNTIEQTEKRDGKVIEVSKMTVSPDGGKMTIVSNSKLTGRTSTYYAVKVIGESAQK